MMMKLIDSYKVIMSILSNYNPTPKYSKKITLGIHNHLRIDCLTNEWPPDLQNTRKSMSNCTENKRQRKSICSSKKLLTNTPAECLEILHFLCFDSKLPNPL